LPGIPECYFFDGHEYSPGVLLGWEGEVDFYVTREVTGGARGAWPKEHSLVMPVGLTPEVEPVLTTAMVRKLVDAYNQ
jgi:hypothetical protein